MLRLEQAFAQLLQLRDVRFGSGRLAAARRTHGAREMRDRLGCRERRAERLQLRRALPVLALEVIACRDRRARGIAGGDRPDYLLHLSALLDKRFPI